MVPCCWVPQRGAQAGRHGGGVGRRTVGAAGRARAGQAAGRRAGRGGGGLAHHRLAQGPASAAAIACAEAAPACPPQATALASSDTAARTLRSHPGSHTLGVGGKRGATHTAAHTQISSTLEPSPAHPDKHDAARGDARVPCWPRPASHGHLALDPVQRLCAASGRVQADGGPRRRVAARRRDGE